MARTQTQRIEADNRMHPFHISLSASHPLLSPRKNHRSSKTDGRNTSATPQTPRLPTALWPGQLVNQQLVEELNVMLDVFVSFKPEEHLIAHEDKRERHLVCSPSLCHCDHYF
jgi:hypothetical protein